MESLVVTVAISIVLVFLAVAGLAIGLILTGKSKITRGTCGYNPKKERSDDCGKKIKCGLCSRERD